MAETVEALRAVLAAGGEFTEPVVVQEGQLRNGTHRVVASVLEGRDTIATSYWYPPDSGPRFEIEFRAPMPAGDEGDDLIGRVMARTSSFPLAGGWVETDGCGWFGGRFEGVWRCPDGVTGEELAAAVAARVEALGVTVSVEGCRPWVDEDEAAS